MIANNNSPPQWIKYAKMVDRKSDGIDSHHLESVRRNYVNHEQFNSETGAFVQGAELGYFDGSSVGTLAIKVPHRVLVGDGVSVAAYSAGELEATAQGSPIDVSSRDSVTLKFEWCDGFGIGAIGAVKGPFIRKMMAGGALMVVAKGLDEEPLYSAISLAGFREVAEGPAMPVDEYRAKRQAILRKLTRETPAPDFENCISFLEACHGDLTLDD